MAVVTFTLFMKTTTVGTNYADCDHENVHKKTTMVITVMTIIMMMTH